MAEAIVDSVILGTPPRITLKVLVFPYQEVA